MGPRGVSAHGRFFAAWPFSAAVVVVVGVCFFPSWAVALVSGHGGGAVCNGTVSGLPVWAGSLREVARVANGVRLAAGEPGQSLLHVVQTRGTPLQQGLAMGQLFRAELPHMLNLTLAMVDAYLDEVCGRRLEPLCKILEDGGVVQDVLVAFAHLVRPWTPAYVLDEIRGMALATGLSAELLEGMANIPEIIKGSCSMVGALGPAVPAGAGLQQLRALMLKPYLTLQAYPVVAVAFHDVNTTDDDAVAAEARVGFLGLPGVLTGLNSAGLLLSEKSHGEYLGGGAQRGEPWAYVLRDVVRRARTAEQAVAMLAAAERTWPLYLGVGHTAGPGTFYLVEYAHDVPLNVTDWRNCTTYPTHPRIPGLAFIDEFSQPSRDPCYAQVLAQLAGNVTAENMARYLAPLAQTGGLHAVTMNAQQIYVANAKYPLTGDGSRTDAADSAFNRQFVRLDTATLFEYQV